MKVGDLVKHAHHSENVGIIVAVFPASLVNAGQASSQIQWFEGGFSLRTINKNIFLEVISESR